MRFDPDRNRFLLEHCATLVKVLVSPHQAKQEASRLREVNQAKDCTGVIRTARFVSTADSRTLMLMAESCLLYYITDRRTFAVDESERRRYLLQKIGEAARAGVDYIQLREKDLPARALESLARQSVAILGKLRTEHRELRTKLLINSRTDVALALGADGVHLRSDDVAPEEVKRIWSCGAGAPARGSRETPLIGVSCHSPKEVGQAEASGATFAVFAPVFEKKNFPGQRPAGLMQLREVSKAEIPVLALGGVTLENAKQCLYAGAAGIAAIRLFQDNDMATVVAQLRASL